jgi:hypothetical protein
MKANRFEIEVLIHDRIATLKLDRSDLVRRAGFKNVAKGLRRLDQLCSGELKATRALIAGLPAALELPPEVIFDAIRQTERQIAEAKQIAKQQEDAVWRANFRPCAFLVGTTTRPSSGFMFEISGGTDRWLRIPLDLSQSLVTFRNQALDVVRTTPSIMFFGATTGFVINYTPDFALRFDVNGNMVEMLARAYRPGPRSGLTMGMKVIRQRRS